MPEQTSPSFIARPIATAVFDTSSTIDIVIFVHTRMSHSTFFLVAPQGKSPANRRARKDGKYDHNHDHEPDPQPFPPGRIVSRLIKQNAGIARCRRCSRRGKGKDEGEDEGRQARARAQE